MNLSLKIAARYFFSRKRKGGYNAVTLISYVSLLGFTVGAAALLIVLSVFNGFESMFGNMYSRFDPDLLVVPASGKEIQLQEIPINQLLKIEGVKGISQVWEENALLRYNEKQTIATIKAVDDSYLEINPLDTYLVRGEMLLNSGDTFFAVAGEGIGYQLGVDPDDPFRYLGVYIPRKGKVSLADPQNAFAHGVIFPVGVFSVQEEVNNKYVIMPLTFVRNQLEDSNLVSQLEFRYHAGANHEQIRDEVKKLLGNNYILKSRFEQRESFFKVMQSEKTISYFILVFILLIAAFNTTGSLYMMVIEKKRDLFVFSSLGFSASEAFKVFIFQGIIISVIGGVSGIILGVLICLGQQEFGWIALQSYGDDILSYYPVLLKAEDVLKVFFTLLGMGVLTAIYPAKKASDIMKENR